MDFQSIVFSIVMSLFGLTNFSMEGGLPTDGEFAAIGMMSLSGFVFVGLLLYVYSLLYGYMKGYADSDGDQETAKSYASTNVGGIMGRLILFSLALFSIAFGLSLVVIMFIGAGAMGGLLGGVIGVTLIIVLYVFMIYAMIRLMFAQYIYGVGDTGLVDAFKQSWAVTEGNWWFTFGSLLVIGMIIGLAAFVLMIPFAIIMGVAGATAGMGDSGAVVGGTLAIVSMLLMYVVYIAVLMLGVPATMIVYYSLYEERYGHSLAKDIDEVGQRDEGELFENDGEY